MCVAGDLNVGVGRRVREDITVTLEVPGKNENTVQLGF